MTVYCPKCWAVVLHRVCDDCCDEEPIVDESFDAIVDRLMFLPWLERDEAEALALDILEADAA